MIEAIKELGVWVAAAGFKDVRVGDVDGFMHKLRSNVEAEAVQALDADLVAGWPHLYFAALNAVKAMKDGVNITKDLGMEILVFASGRRQITKAIQAIGVKPTTTRVALITITKSREDAEKSVSQASKVINGERNDSILELTSEKMEAVRSMFGITDKELETQLRGRTKAEGWREALVDLVIEHVALLITRE